MNIRVALKRCSYAKSVLQRVYDAVREVQRIEDGGAPNPKWPDPLGSVAWDIERTRAYLTEIEQAMDCHDYQADLRHHEPPPGPLAIFDDAGT